MIKKTPNNKKPKDSSPEERIQWLYKEIYKIGDTVTEMNQRQKDLEKLMLNLLKEYQNIKNFNDKFLT